MITLVYEYISAGLLLYEYIYMSTLLYEYISVGLLLYEYIYMITLLCEYISVYCYGQYYSPPGSFEWSS